MIHKVVFLISSEANCIAEQCSQMGYVLDNRIEPEPFSYMGEDGEMVNSFCNPTANCLLIDTETKTVELYSKVDQQAIDEGYNYKDLNWLINALSVGGRPE